MNLLLCLLFLFGGSDREPEPSTTEQNTILEHVRAYAEQYAARLPNFICFRDVQESRSKERGKKWKPSVQWTEQLSIVDREEKLSLVVTKSNRGRRGAALQTQGEFGQMLVNVFQSQADLTWNGWDTRDGKRVAVFQYAIDQEHSSLFLTGFMKARLGYTGLLYAEPDSGKVLRITDTAAVPPELGSRSISTELDYGDVAVGTARFTLPVHAVVVLENFNGLVRNEIRYRDYRKFGAESSITFGNDDSAAQPR